MRLLPGLLMAAELTFAGCGPSPSPAGGLSPGTERSSTVLHVYSPQSDATHTAVDAITQRMPLSDLTAHTGVPEQRWWTAASYTAS